MARAFLPLLLLLAACGQPGSNPTPPYFSCGSGGGEKGALLLRGWGLEVVLLREVVEAAPGTRTTLPVRMRLREGSEARAIHLSVSARTPRGEEVLGLGVAVLRGGEEKNLELDLWVGHDWPFGNYQACLWADEVSRPFSLRVR